MTKNVSYKENYEKLVKWQKSSNNKWNDEFIKLKNKYLKNNLTFNRCHVTCILTMSAVFVTDLEIYYYYYYYKHKPDACKGRAQISMNHKWRTNMFSESAR